MTAVAQHLHRILLQPETAVGSPEGTPTSAVVLFAEDVAYAQDRGEGLISREGLADGRIGEIAGVMGSRGWSISFSQEVGFSGATAAASGYIPPIASTPLASGHYATAVDDGTGGGTENAWDFTPVQSAPIAWEQTAQSWTGAAPDLAAGDNLAPVGVTFRRFVLTEDQFDTSYTAGSVAGSSVIRWESGQRAMIEFSGHGQFVDETIQGGTVLTGLDALGAFDTYTTPAVAKSASITITRNDSSDGSTPSLNVFACRGLVLNGNQEVVEIPCSASSDGLAPSRVVWGTPTIEFSLGADATNVEELSNGYDLGDIFDFSATIESGQGYIELSGKFQLDSAPIIEDVDGYAGFTLTGRLVLDALNEADPIYKLRVKP